MYHLMMMKEKKKINQLRSDQFKTKSILIKINNYPYVGRAQASRSNVIPILPVNARPIKL